MVIWIAKEEWLKKNTIWREVNKHVKENGKLVREGVFCLERGIDVLKESRIAVHIAIMVLENGLRNHTLENI